MTPKFVAFLGFAWIICTFMCLVIQGTFFSDTEMNVINMLTGYNTLELGGLWGVPRLAIGFFTTGFPKLILWDYSFINHGSYQIIQYILIATLSTGAVWGLVSAFIGILQRVL
jgi:hypothetical protein